MRFIALSPQNDHSAFRHVVNMWNLKIKWVPLTMTIDLRPQVEAYLSYCL